MSHSLSLARSLALSLMLFGLSVQVTAGALTITDGAPSTIEQHHGGDDHDHAATPTLSGSFAEAQTASIGGDVLDALAAFFAHVAAAARGAYICGDCNLPSDDGCQCVCWSGNPRPGDCD